MNKTNKKLGCYFNEISANGVDWILFGESGMRYEIPEETLSEYDFDEFWDHNPYYFGSLKTFWKKRKYINVYSFTGSCIKIFKEDVKDHILVRCRFYEFNYQPKMQALMNKLNADEFIDYMKDNGINVCPILS